MDHVPPPSHPRGSPDGHHSGPGDEWTETLVRTVAHLAAQLTVTQVRLRALATALHEQGTVDEDGVGRRLRAIAATDAGGYLRENLGPALVEVVDVETLEQDLLVYLVEPATD